MKKTIYLLGILLLVSVSNIFAQLNLPRESQRQEIAQTVGDARIALVYHRPKVKARKIWGDIVPYGKVWRTGANENTTFETNRDVTINGQPLAAGKYGFHAIPGETEWTLIFNKTNDAWGSFSYDEKKDALRVKVKPEAHKFKETLIYEFGDVTANEAKVVLNWENLSVPFTVNVGDVNARTLTYLRGEVSKLKADDTRSPIDAANFIYAQKMTANYAEAIGWLDSSLKIKETGSALAVKSYLLAETGKKTEAVTTLERAITVTKAANPKANTSALEKRLADWKSGKWQTEMKMSM
jgi:hypothetical protein